MVVNVNMERCSSKWHLEDAAGKSSKDDVSLACISRSLLFTLKYFYGIYVSNDELTKWQTCHSLLCSAFVITWFVLVVLMIFLSESTGITNFVYILSVSTSGTQIFFTYLVLSRRRKQLHHMLRALKEISRVTIKENVDNIDDVKRSYVEGKRMFIAIKIIAVAFSICIPLQIIQDASAASGSHSSFRRIVMTFVHSADAFLYPLLITGFDLYLFSCHVLYTALSSIGGNGGGGGGGDRARRSRHFNKVRKFHRQIADGVRVTDAVFKELFFVWNAAGYAAILSRLRRMNLHVINYNIMVLNVILLVTHGVFFAAANTNAGHVNEQIVASLKEVFPMIDDESMIIYGVQTAEDVKLKLYIQSILLTPPALTAWTAYTPASSTIFTAIGGIVSYVLVLYHIPETGSQSVAD